MRFATLATTVFLALAGFSAAMPSAEAGVSIAEDGPLGTMVEERQRSCRKLRKRCRRDRQCCSRNCDDGRCRRRDDDGDDD